MPIRVALADDQTLIRQGLAYIVQSQPDMTVAGEAADGEAIVRLCAQMEVDVILMDIQMPGQSGIDATRAIMEAHPAVKVVLLTTFDREDYVLSGMRAGAVGYLLKGADTHELLDGVRAAYRGEAIYRTPTASRAVAQACIPAPQPTDPHGALMTPLDPLTERELDVLQQMAYGLRNSDIAERLFLSEGTVKTHVHRILQKLGAEDRTQAVVFAIRNRLVQ